MIIMISQGSENQKFQGSGQGESIVCVKNYVAKCLTHLYQTPKKYIGNLSRCGLPNIILNCDDAIMDRVCALNMKAGRWEDI